MKMHALCNSSFQKIKKTKNWNVEEPNAQNFKKWTTPLMALISSYKRANNSLTANQAPFLKKSQKHFKKAVVHILTGVKPTLRGTHKLKEIYKLILRSLEKHPKDCAYRRNTETIVSYRLSVVEGSETNCEIENTICCGTLEMLIRQAMAEYELSQKLCLWKVWEPLTQKPHPEQWKWPPLVK